MGINIIFEHVQAPTLPHMHHIHTPLTYWQRNQQNHNKKWSHYLGVYQTAAWHSQTFYTLLNIYFPRRKGWHDTLIGNLSTVTLFNNNSMWRFQQTNNHQGWVWQTENTVFQFLILSPFAKWNLLRMLWLMKKHWFCNLRNPLWSLQ